jgi:hypothetical protein
VRLDYARRAPVASGALLAAVQWAGYRNLLPLTSEVSAATRSSYTADH